MTHRARMISVTVAAPSRSFLFPRMSRGTEARDCDERSCCSSNRAVSNFSFCTAEADQYECENTGESMIAYICRVYHKAVGRHGQQGTAAGPKENAHNRIHPIAVSLPHGPELRLSCDIPDFESDIASADFAEVEGDGRDDILAPLMSRGRVSTSRAGVSRQDECVPGQIQSRSRRKSFLMPERYVR
jgi:hypothetical protein